MSLTRERSSTATGAGRIGYDDPWHGVDLEDTERLLAFIREKELEIDRIVGSHGRVARMAELAEAVPMAR